jgi:hypothetical protein
MNNATPMYSHNEIAAVTDDSVFTVGFFIPLVTVGFFIPFVTVGFFIPLLCLFILLPVHAKLSASILGRMIGGLHRDSVSQFLGPTKETGTNRANRDIESTLSHAPHDSSSCNRNRQAVVSQARKCID